MSARTSLDVGRGVAASNERSRFASVLSTGCTKCTDVLYQPTRLYLVTTETWWPAGQFSTSVYYEVSGMFISAESEECALHKAKRYRPEWNEHYMNAIECNEDFVEKQIGGTPLSGSFHD